MAQMLYQARGIGATKGEIRMMRRAAKEAAGGAAARTCTTTKLYLAYGKGQDPAIRVRKEQAKEWTKLWCKATPQMKKGIAEVWNGLEQKEASARSSGRTVASSGRKRNWNAVTGPISAWRQTLKDIGWQTQRVTCYTNEQGTT